MTHLGTTICKFCEVKLTPMESIAVNSNRMGILSEPRIGITSPNVKLPLKFCPRCGLVYHA